MWVRGYFDMKHPLVRVRLYGAFFWREGIIRSVRRVFGFLFFAKVCWREDLVKF